MLVLRRPVLAALLSFTTATAMGQTAPPYDYAKIDLESAQRSIERNTARPHPMALLGCPYTTTPLNFTSGQTGTPFDEKTILMTPCGFNPNGPDLPLIVIFNGFCLGAPAIFAGITQIPDEANARGWLVLAITLGGDALSKKSYGVSTAQPNVEFVLDYVIQNYPVDTNRIYGVGWSAGGGAIVSYGARHLDPAKPMFAAIATDAGTFDMIDTYNTVTPDVQTFLASNLMFHGIPSNAAFTFNYLRTSTILYTPPSSPIDATQSQVKNLTKTPIYQVYSTDDPITNLKFQQSAFASYLNSQSAPITTQTFSGLPSPHSFDLLAPVATLDFFQSKSLNASPSSFSINADRSATWYWANLTQRTTGLFSRLTCATNTGTNTLTVSGVDNVSALALSPPAGTVDLDANFTLSFQTVDRQTTNVTLTGLDLAPSYFLEGTSLFKTWSYDSNAKTATLTIPGNGTHILTAHYDGYSATVTGPATVQHGTKLTMQFTGSTPNQVCVFFLGFNEAVIPLNLFDPGDSRNLLVDLASAPLLFPSVLDGTGHLTLPVPVPNSISLIGTTIRTQFVTLPGGSTIVDEISNRLDVLVQ